MDVSVTITVAVYNGSKHLEGCIASIASQTYRDFEVLFVVDSKTDDDSVEIIERLSVDLPSSRIVIQEDKDRLSGARNIGIKEAKGDIIWFLDVDDHPYPTFLEDLVRIMDENDADMVFCNHFQECDPIVPEIEDRDYGIEVYDGHSAVGRFSELPVYSWSRIQRASIFESGDAFFYNHGAAEDIEQTIRSLAVSDRVVYYGKPLYVYYKLGGSATQAHRGAEAESIENTARRMSEFVRERCPDQYDGFRRRMLERLMRQMAFVGYKEYKRVYSGSIAHEFLREIDDRTMEMRVFSMSKTLYYLILLPFTRKIWDGKTGPWGRF